MWTRNNWTIAGTVVLILVVGGALAVALADGVNSPSGIPTGQLPGTATNDNAAAGNVGEYIVSTIASGSAVSLTTGAAKTITSISLTPGDWQVSAIPGIVGTGTTTLQALTTSISTTNNSTGASPARTDTFYSSAGVTAFSTIGQIVLPVGPIRASLNATATYYLVAACSFAASTCSGFGTIQAWRVR